MVMAAFCHPAPGGGRFNTDALGAWYCATEIETAIAETAYHHTRRLAHSASGFRHTIQMRELISVLDSPMADIRGLRAIHPDLYDPDNYAASQILARPCAGRARMGSCSTACAAPAAKTRSCSGRASCRRFSRAITSIIAGAAARSRPWSGSRTPEEWGTHSRRSPVHRAADQAAAPPRRRLPN